MLDELSEEAKAESTAFVIFGVTGDLTRRKLMPAIYELAASDRLPVHFQVVGFARRDWTDEILVQNLSDGINQFAHSQPTDKDVIQKTLAEAVYISSDFNNPEGYERLAKLLNDQADL